MLGGIFGAVSCFVVIVFACALWDKRKRMQMHEKIDTDDIYMQNELRETAISSEDLKDDTLDPPEDPASDEDLIVEMMPM